MTEPERRPRPQYGEYATAQEQRDHIREPRRMPVPPVVPPPAQEAEPVRQGPPPARPGAANRVVTLGLLAYGVANVILSAFSFLDLPTALNTAYKTMGITGTFAGAPSVHMWGVIAALVLVAGYAVTVIISVRVMRRGGTSWWIPVAGAVATYIVVGACIMVPVLSDPTFLAFATGH